MRARILEPSEWHRLDEAWLPSPAQYVRPEDVAVIVVEEGDRIIACMAVLRAAHLEGAWISPEHRNAGVTRALLRLSMEMARVWGGSWTFAGAECSDERMRGILTRLGGRQIPVDTWVLPLGGAGCRQL